MGIFDFFLKRNSVQNTSLEKIMLEMIHHHDMKVRRTLYSELLKSVFLLPTPNNLEASSGKIPLKEIQLVTQPGPRNELVWIAFTNKTALQRWRPQFQDAYVAIRGDQIFSLALQNGVENILINPAGPVAGKITKMELQLLAEGTFPGIGDGKTHTIGTKEQTLVRMGTPVQPLKPQLVGYLQGKLEKSKDVIAGYVMAMVIGGGTPHLVLGIEYIHQPVSELAKPIMDSIGFEIHAFLGSGEYLDMVSFDENHKWCKSFKKNGVLVYQKQMS